jgi:hypothetical protein
MKIGKVPTPLVLPFGFFPNKKNGSRGDPHSRLRRWRPLGYFLLNGGYYMPWATGPTCSSPATSTAGAAGACGLARYKVRYRFRGSWT